MLWFPLNIWFLLLLRFHHSITIGTFRVFFSRQPAGFNFSAHRGRVGPSHDLQESEILGGRGRNWTECIAYSPGRPIVLLFYSAGGIPRGQCRPRRGVSTSLRELRPAVSIGLSGNRTVSVHWEKIKKKNMREIHWIIWWKYIIYNLTIDNLILFSLIRTTVETYDNAIPEIVLSDLVWI